MLYEAMLEHLHGVMIPQDDFRAIQMQPDWDHWQLGLPPQYTDLIQDLRAMTPMGISRNIVFQLRNQVANNEWDPPSILRLFLAVMVWGYSDRGYGPRRTAEIIAGTPNLAARLDQARVALLGNDGQNAQRISAAYAMFNDAETEIPGLGESFFTKLLYFLGYDVMPADEARPLILDETARRGLMRHALPHDDFRTLETFVGFTRPESPDGYRNYCQWMHGWAQELHIAPDRLEWFFFTEGQ